MGLCEYIVIHFTIDLLSKPLNLTSENVNSTHVRIVWDRPPSLMDHNTTRYEGLLTKNGDIVQNITTSAQELIFQRPSPSILLFAVTSINPVGRGGTETLNLTSLSEDCETLGVLLCRSLVYTL